MKISGVQLRQLIREEVRSLQEYGADTHMLVIDKLSAALDNLHAASDLARNGALEPADARTLENITTQLAEFSQSFD